MKLVPTATPLSALPPPSRIRLVRRGVPLIAAGILFVLALVAWATAAPRWLAAIGIALTLFSALKLATLHGHWHEAPVVRILAYLTLWPGMNARTFLLGARESRPTVRVVELVFALSKLSFGLALIAAAITALPVAPPRLAGGVGITGFIFVFHFGLFHALSWIWRHAGVTAPPLMRAPIAARSLAEFWGERWNTAFAELGRRFVVRPLARGWGAPRAGLVVFLASGIVHEVAISLPARGGWGGPTVYFLLQAAGVAVEKSPMGRRFYLGAGFPGWLWAHLVTLAPLPLLFHAPLIERVVVPLLETIAKEVL